MSRIKVSAYQFPMGKVKGILVRKVIHVAVYQFPMGKVKNDLKLKKTMDTYRINSQWER